MISNWRKSKMKGECLFHQWQDMFSGATQSLIIGVLVAVIFMARAAGADIIHLKGGRTIQGVIDSVRSDDQRVFIRTSGGQIPIPRSKIDRIEIRENVSSEELKGDLAAEAGELDQALGLYLAAAEKSKSDDEELKKKITDIETQIKDRDEKRFKTEFEQIDQAIDRKEYTRAIEICQNLKDSINDVSGRRRCGIKIAESYMAMARDLRNKVDYTRAEEAYRSAIANDAQSATAHLELAQLIELYPSREDEAFDYYTKGIELALEDPSRIDPSELLQCRYNCAELFMKDLNYRKAAELYWLVVETDIKNDLPKAVDTIVQAYEAILKELIEDNEENRKVVQILQNIVKMRAGSSNASSLLGRIYYNRKDYVRAIEPLEIAVHNDEAIGQKQNLADSRYYLAVAYHKAQRINSAAEQLQKLLEDQPSRYEAICELGEIYLETLHYDQSLAQFNRARAIEPSNYRAYLGFARTYSETKRYREAVDQYKALIELRDDNPHYFYEMGLILTRLERYVDARQALAKALELLENKILEEAYESDGDMDARQVMAQIYAQIGLTDIAERTYFQAIENFTKALTFGPQLAEAMDGRGQAYRQLSLGQTGDERNRLIDLAESSFQDAIRTDPANPNYDLNLGILYHKVKEDKASALKCYLTYYEKNGNDPQVREWIRECGGSVSEGS